MLAVFVPVVVVASLADAVSVEVPEVEEAVSVEVASEVEASVVDSGDGGQHFNNAMMAMNVYSPARRSSRPLPKIIPYDSPGQAEATVPRRNTVHSTLNMKDRIVMVAKTDVPGVREVDINF